MAYYKLTEQATLNKFVPEKINIWGGIGAEVVSILEKGDIIDVVKIDSTDYEKGMIKGTYYFTADGNFVAVSDFFNPLTKEVSSDDIAKYTLKKVTSITEKPAQAIMDIINPNLDSKVDAVAISKSISDATVIKPSDVITKYQGDNPISNEELIKQLPKPTLYQRSKNYWYVPVGGLIAYLIYRKVKN
jgi:hypothetical protein